MCAEIKKFNYKMDKQLSPSCITNPSITCVRTCGFTIALGGACLLFIMITGPVDESSPITPFVIEFTVLAIPANGLLHCFSSVVFATIGSSSRKGVVLH